MTLFIYFFKNDIVLLYLGYCVFIIVILSIYLYFIRD